jgi:predicted RecB family nuclease
LDIEGTPATRSYYLIGHLVCRSGAIEKKPFWDDTEHEEVQMLMELLDYIKQYPECSTYHYGAYEVRALRSMQRIRPARTAAEFGPSW